MSKRKITFHNTRSQSKRNLRPVQTYPFESVTYDKPKKVQKQKQGRLIQSVETVGQSEDLDQFKKLDEIQINNQEAYQVDKILSRKDNKFGIPFYLIKWKGYDISEATYEPVSCLKGLEEMIDEFNHSKVGRAQRNTKRAVKNQIKKRVLKDKSEKNQTIAKLTLNHSSRPASSIFQSLTPTPEVKREPGLSEEEGDIQDNLVKSEEQEGSQQFRLNVIKSEQNSSPQVYQQMEKQREGLARQMRNQGYEEGKSEQSEEEKGLDQQQVQSNQPNIPEDLLAKQESQQGQREAREEGEEVRNSSNNEEFKEPLPRSTPQEIEINVPRMEGMSVYDLSKQGMIPQKILGMMKSDDETQRNMAAVLFKSKEVPIRRIQVRVFTKELREYFPMFLLEYYESHVRFTRD